MMLFVRYFSCYILLFLFSQTACSTVFEKKCGKYIYNVKVMYPSDPFQTHFKLYLQEKKGKKILFYKTISGIELIAACMQGKNKNILMVFQEFCGGNGCPEDMYGIFDPDTRKMLLEPTDWSKGNSKQAKNILGYEIPSLVHDDRSFCCDKRKYVRS